MKKLLGKLRTKTDETPSRITNETVAEHREKILAGGRKFKYPVQYARHRLVFNAVIVTLVTVVLLLAVGWWQLYPMQNSSGFMYRVTRIIPVPVASVNGNWALYQDYLVQYRASEFYLGKYGEIKLDTPDGKRQLDYVKRQALDKSEMIAYAHQLAKKQNITVTKADVDSFIDQERNTVNGRVSQETYDASARMLYDWSVDDYRLTIANGILRSKVAFAVDDDAAAQAKRAEVLVKASNGDFVSVADQMKGTKGGAITVGQSGLISTTSKLAGLRVSDIANLAKGDVSGLLRSTTDDGYYFVKIIDKSASQVNFLYLHIPLTKFSNDFAALKKDNKIQEFISVSQTTN